MYYAKVLGIGFQIHMVFAMMDLILKSKVHILLIINLNNDKIIKVGYIENI